MKNRAIIKKTFVLQQDQTDCGVACLLSLINYNEGDSSLEKLREASGTSRQGTTLLGLYQAANSLGFKAQGCEASIEALKEHGAPVILHVLIEERLQHYVVCYGYEDGKFVIGDPAKGIRYLSEEELEVIWKSKNCLILTPTEDFVQASTTKTKKRDWFKQLLKEDIRLLSISAGFGVVITVLGMSMAIFSQKLIDDILPSGESQRLILGIVLLSFLLLVRVGVSSLREFLLIRQSKDFNNRIINSFYKSLLNLPKPFFDTRKTGDLVARLNDTRRIQDVIKQVARSFVVDALMAVISIGFLFYYSWQIGLIALVSLPVYFLIIYRFNKDIINSQKEVMQGYGLSESNYITTMNGIASIKNNNKQTVFSNLNSLIYGNYQEKTFQLGKINVKLSLLAGAAGTIFMVGMLSFGSFYVFTDLMSAGELMAILGIAGSLLPSITNLALITIPINEAKIAFNRMFEFASIEKEAAGETPLTSIEKIEFKDVSFRFAGRKQLLRGIDLSVHKNELVAITGESGSGKSTLGQILQKFYNFESGSIMVNDTTALDKVVLEDWRDKVGVIPQEIVIFPGNVIDNILLGTEDTPENVVAFCKAHGFEDFIAQLPHGYNTLLGESGINLSGGQKQIIALARALYKKPELLILDEATSAMDRKTERFAMNLLERLKEKMAIFFISHRLHSLRNLADTIYVLEDGVIQVKGDHKELMKTENFYSDFWRELETDTLATIAN